MGAVADVVAAAAEPDLARLIQYAVLAPSGHNTQPWRFAVDSRSIRILPDRSRRLPVVDPDDRELLMSLGCALENLVVAASQAGFDPAVAVFPADEPQDCLRVRLAPAASPVAAPLFAAIAERRTNRRHYDGRPIPPDDLARLSAVACEPGVAIHLLTAPDQFATIVDLVREGDRRQLEDEPFRAELSCWIRFNAAEAATKGDGLAAAAMETPEVPRWIGERVLCFVLTGERQAVKDERVIQSSPALALVTTAADDRRAWVAAGRTFERFALTATTLGIQLAHLNQPCEVPGLRGELTRRLGQEGRHAQLLVRLGYAEPLPRSPRRPLDAVLLTEGRPC